MEGPCQVDLMNEREVIRYFRDLLNLSHLLKNGLDHEMAEFKKKLKAVGYGAKQISQFVTLSGYGTRYEQLIPRPIPEAGDYREFRRDRSRKKT
jgi:hypothetical protein